MTKKNGLPYTEAAEILTVTGWACKTCRRWWGDDEHMARYCCATTAICGDCKVEHGEKGYTACEACREKRAEARWQELLAKAVPWDGKAPLYSEAYSRYFFDADETRDFLDTLAFDKIEATPESLHLCVCEPNNGREFDIEEYLSDDLPDEDHGDPHLPGSRELNKIVNDWIKERAPLSWHGGKPVILSTVFTDAAEAPHA